MFYKQTLYTPEWIAKLLLAGEGSMVCDQLLEPLAMIIKDYRRGDIAEPAIKRIDTWVNQFPDEKRVPILEEMVATLKLTYFSRERIREEIDGWCGNVLPRLLRDGKFVGIDCDQPESFWRKTNFLRIQKSGRSQAWMLGILDEVLQARYRFGIDDCGDPHGHYLYLDDGVFTGSRVRQDMMSWMEGLDAPSRQRSVLVFALMLAKSAEWSLFQNRMSNLDSKAQRLECMTAFNYEFMRSIENRRRQVVRDDLEQHPRGEWEVLWPAEDQLGSEAERWIRERNDNKRPEPRSAHRGRYKPFSSPQGRQLLEAEFVHAGARIINGHENVKAVWRPLGYNKYQWGFGSMFITERNCPNNCPLALWWGVSDSWVPLLPRCPEDE